MFWGLVMDPNKWYRQTVEIPFHVSMATLDIANASDEIVQVMLCYNETNYQLCNLKKDSVWQVLLDLNFEKGTEIAFTCNGQSHVYLTGYLKFDENFDLDKQEKDDDDNNKDIEEGEVDNDNDDGTIIKKKLEKDLINKIKKTKVCSNSSRSKKKIRRSKN